MQRKNLFVAMVLTVVLAISALANGKDKLTIDLFMDWETVAAPQQFIRQRAVRGFTPGGQVIQTATDVGTALPGVPEERVEVVNRQSDSED